MFRQNFADALRRVAIREEKPDGFAATELETFVINLDLPGAGEMKSRDDALQIRTAVFNRKFQFAIRFFNSQIEQKRHQPVAGQGVVVLRQNLFHPGGVIFSGRKIGAEQQKILLRMSDARFGKISCGSKLGIMPKKVTSDGE